MSNSFEIKTQMKAAFPHEDGSRVHGNINGTIKLNAAAVESARECTSELCGLEQS